MRFRPRWMSESRYFAIFLTIAFIMVGVGVLALILHPSLLTFFLLIALAVAAAPVAIIIANLLDHP